MKLIYFIVWWLVLFYPCKDNRRNYTENGSEKIYVPRNIEKKNIIEQSTIIDSSYIIKLETKRECLIGQISDFKIINNKIYVLDTYKSVGLYEFDIKGNFIKKIGEKGKGPGEYLKPSSFDIKKNGEIIIYDTLKKTILTYNSEGEFKKSIKIENKNVIQLSILEPNTFFLDAHIKNTREIEKNAYSLLKFDEKKEQIIQKFLKTGDNGLNPTGLTSRNSFFKYESSILYNPTCTNKIFKITQQNVELLYEIDFENKSIPKELFKTVKFTDFLHEVEKGNYSFFYNIGGYVFIKDYFFFHVKTGGNFREPYVYNTKNKKLYKINPKNDKLDFGFYVRNLCTYKNEYIVDYAFPEWYLKDKKFSLEKVKGTKMEAFIKNSKIEDNPILIFNHIKDNI